MNLEITIEGLKSQVTSLEAAKEDAYKDGCDHAEAKMNALLEEQKDIYEAQLEQAREAARGVSQHLQDSITRSTAGGLGKDSTQNSCELSE